jgi:hypothetical protein
MRNLNRRLAPVLTAAAVAAITGLCSGTSAALVTLLLTRPG